MEKSQVIDRIKRLAQTVLPKGSSLWLYGSRARGDENASSDWDLLILLNGIGLQENAFSQYAYPFVELGWEYGTYFSPKIYTYSEWASRKGTPFYDNVNKEGIALC